MTQEYTPVAWQDETTSQQGTLINAERLNQMQTAHHYADGFEEVDAVPTADPSVAYHKIVYCTADNTIYRWDGTEWTKDIDDETKALLQQEIARATEAEGELAQDLADETTARETADTAMQADITAMQGGKVDKKTTAPNQTQAYAVRGSAQRMITVGYGPESIPIYGMEETLLAKMPTLYDPTADTVVNYGWATAQIGAEATARVEADTALGGRIDTEQARAEAAEQANAQAIANTYTKAETDTLLAGKASTSAVQTLDTRVGALETGLADTYNKSQTDTLLATKLDTLSTAGLHAYTHNGATQSEVAVIDGTTASTIPIRGANGRLQAADPASGATDKSLATANWISQSGDDGPNNLLHRNGNETKTGILTIERLITRSLYFNARSGPTTNTWRHMATVSGTNNARVWGILHYNQSQRFGFFEMQLGANPKFYLFIKKSINVNNVAINYDGDGTYYVMIRTPYFYQGGAIMPIIIQSNDQINTSVYQEVDNGTIYNDASEFPLANTIYGQFEGVDSE